MFWRPFDEAPVCGAQPAQPHAAALHGTHINSRSSHSTHHMHPSAGPSGPPAGPSGPPSVPNHPPINKLSSAHTKTSTDKIDQALPSSINNNPPISINLHAIKPPPIILHTDAVKNTIAQLSNIINDFNIKRINNNKHILQTYSLENYKLACDKLRDLQIQFFTYTPKSDKNFTVLLKNIEGNFEPDEILYALTNLKTEGLTFVSVKRFTTKKATDEGRVLPIFIVQLSADSNIKNLSQIKSILHTIVKWEKIVKRDRIQCVRCQRLGHVAGNCNLKYRCVKCEFDHKPGECLRSANSPAELEKSTPYCVNCKQHGHPASYRGCPKILEIKEKIEARKLEFQTDKDNRRKFTSNYTKSGISFSQIASNIKTHTDTTSHVNAKQTNTPQIHTNLQTQEQTHDTLLSQIKHIIEATIKTHTEPLLTQIQTNSNKINTLADALITNKLLNA
ncbi:uncharacterized protein LOC143213027 isoform X1 [Lasioglossum baleicum]|uniref:uncharacterized protein LOC143213027 isoform X1 n=1 Tax=Lasioglossum baleicum TaxID=434251 RepID=UPI003FCD4090